MFNISKITEQHPWSLNSCYNRNIDFCVWVLQVAGLQLSPFNYHNFSNSKILGNVAGNWTIVLQKS